MNGTVPGIEEVKKMKSSGDFDVEKVVAVIDANEDIIRKVEVGERYINVYMNLSVDKHRFVDGIADMYSKFNALSVDLSCGVGVRIFKFLWSGQ